VLLRPTASEGSHVRSVSRCARPALGRLRAPRKLPTLARAITPRMRVHRSRGTGIRETRLAACPARADPIPDPRILRHSAARRLSGLRRLAVHHVRRAIAPRGPRHQARANRTAGRRLMAQDAPMPTTVARRLGSTPLPTGSRAACRRRGALRDDPGSDGPGSRARPADAVRRGLPRQPLAEDHPSRVLDPAQVQAARLPASGPDPPVRRLGSPLDPAGCPRLRGSGGGRRSRSPTTE
jgi:hypothetical protein